jgi:hypothetical protein
MIVGTQKKKSEKRERFLFLCGTINNEEFQIPNFRFQGAIN